MKQISIFLTLLLVSQPFAQITFRDKASLRKIKYSQLRLEEGEANANLFFKFKGIPSKYYHTLKGNRLVVDFYDTEMPPRSLKPPVQGPFTKITVAEAEVNVQKIKDLPPEMRTVVRISITLKKGLQMDYTCTGEYDLVTLSMVARRGGKIRATENVEKKSRLLVFGIAAGIVVVAAVVISLIVNQSPPNENEDSYKSTGG